MNQSDYEESLRKIMESDAHALNSVIVERFQEKHPDVYSHRKVITKIRGIRRRTGKPWFFITADDLRAVKDGATQDTESWGVAHGLILHLLDIRIRRLREVAFDPELSNVCSLCRSETTMDATVEGGHRSWCPLVEATSARKSFESLSTDEASSDMGEG